MSLFPIRWLFNAMTNAMINAIFIGGVNHGIICIKEPPYHLKGTAFANCYSVKLSET